MQTLPLHPKLVHLPLGLSVILPLIALVLLVAWWRGWVKPSCWRLVIGLQLVLVASAFFAMETGEEEEELVEEVVAERYIEPHEEAAELFFWATVVVLGLAFAGAVLPGQRARQLVALATVAGTFAVLALGIRTGQAGGELVYRHGAAAVYTTDNTVDSVADDELNDDHHGEDDHH